MSHVIENRVHETSSTTGLTRPYVLTGALDTSVVTFASKMTIGDTCWYCAQNGTQMEVGMAQYTAANELTPVGSPLDSSMLGSAVNWTSAPDVFITVPGQALLPALRAQSMRVTYEEANGVAPSAVSTGAYFAIPLNTSVNSISGASLASNQITLPAGMYELYAATQLAQRCRLAIYDTTAGAYIAKGAQNSTIGVGGGPGASVMAHFALSTASVIEVRYRTDNTPATGFGSACSFGDNEVYAEVLIRKIGL